MQTAYPPVKVSDGLGLEMRTRETGPLAANPATQDLLDALILISAPSPVDKSEVTVTLLFAGSQLVPLDVVVLSFQPDGSKYS